MDIFGILTQFIVTFLLLVFTFFILIIAKLNLDTDSHEFVLQKNLVEKKIGEEKFADSKSRKNKDRKGGPLYSNVSSYQKKHK